MPNSSSVLQPQVSPTFVPREEDTSLLSTLAIRERFRDEYWRNRDPIADDRLLWRAQTFRHTVHLLPGQTILELGCGELRFTRALLRITRGENPISVVRFRKKSAIATEIETKVELLEPAALLRGFGGRRFDCVVAIDLLDSSNSSQLLEIVHKLLTPGGEMVFYESNPWNPVHKLLAGNFTLWSVNAIRGISSAVPVCTSFFQRSVSSAFMRSIMISFLPRSPVL